MKALRISGYGGSEVMDYGDAPDPEPGAGEVVVAVHAAGVNPVDWKIRQGFLKGAFGLDFPSIPGRDLSGVVAALGSGVDGLAVGDEVYGTAEAARDGSHAEYVAVNAGSLAAKPRTIDHVEAASLPIAGLSAWTGLVAAGKLADGEQVLIHAGAGGVGSLAIQLARHLGATVATTAGAANDRYVRDLGADVVIDYRSEDFTDILSNCDLVLDTMGGAIHRRSFEVLRTGGRMTFLSAAPIEGDPPRDDVTVERAMVRYTTANFETLAALVDDGAIRPQVSETIPLAEGRRAYETVETGHVRGKIVLTMR